MSRNINAYLSNKIAKGKINTAVVRLPKHTRKRGLSPWERRGATKTMNAALIICTATRPIIIIASSHSFLSLGPKDDAVEPWWEQCWHVMAHKLAIAVVQDIIRELWWNRYGRCSSASNPSRWSCYFFYYNFGSVAFSCFYCAFLLICCSIFFPIFVQLFVQV